MGFFHVDYNRVVWRNIPVLLRDKILYAWLKVIVSPIKYIYSLFTANRAANNYDLAHNGQVCKLEGALRDLFQPGFVAGDNPIYITDDVGGDATYLFLEPEGKDVYVALESEIPVTGYDAPLPLYTDDEIAAWLVSGFVVWVPGYLVYDVDKMKALVNKYKLPGRPFRIENY